MVQLDESLVAIIAIDTLIIMFVYSRPNVVTSQLIPLPTSWRLLVSANWF